MLPALSLPRGGGAIRGIGEKFTTNVASGTASLTIPIASSRGRDGTDLGLELSYDSGAGNGPFGIGWQLSVPAITRKTDKGLPRYLDAIESDVFILAGSEDLVPVRIPDGSGTRLDTFDRVLDGVPYRIQRYRPRVEVLFARIERWTRRDNGESHWRTVTSDNVTSIFGRSTATRIADPRDEQRVFSWLLEETHDDRGNITRYGYKVEDGAGVDPAISHEAARFDLGPGGSRAFIATAQRYLKRIEYGNLVPSQAANWLFEVVFDYGEHDPVTPTIAEARRWPVRADAFSTCRAGFEVRTYRLCRRVLVFHLGFPDLGPQPCLVRSSDFTYDEGPVVTYLTGVTQAGYIRDSATGAYQSATMPPVELGYIRPELHDRVETIDEASLEGVSGGVGHAGSQWVDLDGEGIPGALFTTPRAWFYKRNLGDGRLAGPALLRSLPAPAELADGVQLLTDLAGDGQLDLVQYQPPLSGYFGRTAEGDWLPFKAFRQLPGIDWKDPNLRFVDLDGDGHADVLLTEHQVYTWCRSLARDGFDPAEQVAVPWDEREGPAVVFADGSETVHLADMSGDGLVDIVRVRNGEVCYWPNLGYGRFGRQITLQSAVVFDRPDQFDPARIRFADIDGSGATDVVYLGREGVEIYFNQSGNALSSRRLLRSLAPQHGEASIDLVDLLGQGTACLVRSSTIPGDARCSVQYVDLMGGRKPHLLESIKNNLGGETRIAYAPSTRFYLRDQAEGRPWLTRLPFPVHVIERIEQVDLVARSRLVTRFRYHHGFFDGEEREFRGFARVDQWDTESFGGDKGSGLFADVDFDPGDPDLDLPPVRISSWFHTGAWLERGRLESELAREYYGQDPQAPRLPDTILPAGLSADEARQAARALRGRLLRQETYAEDGTPESAHPYAVSERSYGVRVLQRPTAEAHAVVHSHAGEIFDLQYERRPADPRVQHQMVLQVDDFGNATRTVQIAYPRRSPAAPEQGRLWAVVTERSFAHRTEQPDWYRHSVPIETVKSELTGLSAPSGGDVLTPTQVAAAMVSAVPISFEVDADGVSVQMRICTRERNVYYRDDLADRLPLGQIESRALPYATYRQAMTPGLITSVYGGQVNDAMLRDDGGYVDDDGAWWVHSGHVEYDAARFYHPLRAIDPFGNVSTIEWDSFALLPIEVRDPIGNVTRVDNSYRVLLPVQLTDANGNRTAVELDALGMAVKTAAMGKAGAGEGDTLADPTSRVEYDLHAFRTLGKPASVHTFAREQHGAANPRWQETYVYSDGSGREVLTKVQAEPGPVPVLDANGRLLRNPDGSPRMRHEDDRWVGTGRTVFDNKGNPVKKYEPFFSATPDYEDETDLVEWGVTPVLRHDPLDRLVRTDLPDGTYTLQRFDSWTLETWDENDTVAGTPWLAARQAGTPAEQRAAALALAHSGTPEVSHYDPLGRVFLTAQDNGPNGTYRTHAVLDVDGNERSITDARGVRIQAEVYDMLGRRIDADSADAGRRTILLDAADKPIRIWTPRGHAIRQVYDQLQRLTHAYIRDGASPEKLVEYTVYGEAHSQAVQRNLRGRAHLQFDAAGLVTNLRYDFKGNLLDSERHLARAFRETPDWLPLGALTDMAAIGVAAAPLLEGTPFSVAVSFDAIDRIVSQTTHDGSETRPVYNQANLLERLEVRVRGAATWRTMVDNIDYDARGQRILIAHGSGTTTTYDYDPLTFRLIGLRTVRVSDDVVLQDLRYTHDPVGNVVQLDDAVSFGNPAVPAGGLYEYDALYRLTFAEGREHPGQQPVEGDSPLLRVDHPSDMQGLVRYRESYDYDQVGNILRMAHQPLGGGAAWTRGYGYDGSSNRLLRTSAPGDAPGTLSAVYAHDAAGNMTRMPHLPTMRWDYADRLQATSRQVVNSGTAETTYYVYDGAGQRIRKVTERQAAAGQTPTRKSERIYLGAFELFREYAGDGATVELERESLHVVDGRRQIALVETKTRDANVPGFTPSPRFRFQLENHLDSSIFELDGGGQVIGYEEFFPYGGTSFHAAHSAIEVSAKRYRYEGKERDSETGLYYCEARYYAAWLGRWTAADPAELADGTNGYAFVRGNPIFHRDPSGLDGEDLDIDNPNNPLNPRYETFEDFRAGNRAPYTDEYLRQLWDRAPRSEDQPLGEEFYDEQYEETYYERVTEYVEVQEANAGAGVMLAGAAITQADSPLPGPADVVGAGVIIVGGLIWIFSSSSTRTVPITRTIPRTRTRTRRRQRPLTYITYTRFNPVTGETYAGRAMGYGSAQQVLRMTQAQARHVSMTAQGFLPLRLDQQATATRPYGSRHTDISYQAIRGREQQLIDSYGGAWSFGRGRGGPHIVIPGARSTSANAIRGVGPLNWRGPLYHAASDVLFRPLAPFTGNNPTANIP